MTTIIVIAIMITKIVIAGKTTIDYIEGKATIVSRQMAMEIRRPAELGAYIMSVRRKRGLSQEELASRLGVSRVWVGQIERGKASPRLDLILRTLNELEITLSVASDGEKAAPPHSPALPEDAIDIDAIADTNVPAKSSRRRK